MERRKTLFIIGKEWPEPGSSAAGTRMMQIIDLFQEDGWRVLFASAANESEFAENLQNRKIETVAVNINDSAYDEYIKELQPEIVLFDRFTTEEQFGWRTAENSPHSMRVLDTVDLHSLRLARYQALKEKRKFEVRELRKTDVSKREIASIYRCDLTLMISEVEMEILANTYSIPEHLISYLPFLIDMESVGRGQQDLPGYKERKDFITIGNFVHQPNWDSVLFLKHEIWPLIRKELPDARLHIYGAYPSQKVFQLDNRKEGFLVHGRAESAKHVVRQARVLLAPLRFGAGLKGKLLDSMIWGTPSVTTPIGAEGMAWDGLWNGVIASEPHDIATAAISLYGNLDKWESAQNNGFEIVKKRFSKQLFTKDFVKLIGNRISNLSTNREKNFIGQMLLHHTISGTKYMSRWIEEKNKARRDREED